MIGTKHCAAFLYNIILIKKTARFKCFTLYPQIFMAAATIFQQEFCHNNAMSL